MGVGVGCGCGGLRVWGSVTVHQMRGEGGGGCQGRLTSSSSTHRAHVACGRHADAIVTCDVCMHGDGGDAPLNPPPLPPTGCAVPHADGPGGGRESMALHSVHTQPAGRPAPRRCPRVGARHQGLRAARPALLYGPPTLAALAPRPCPRAPTAPPPSYSLAPFHDAPGRWRGCGSGSWRRASGCPAP